MQSSIVCALHSRARGDDPKAVGLKQHPKNVPKSLVILDQENDMHRIGHVDILIDRGEIRLKMQKSSQMQYKASRDLYDSGQACGQIFTPFGISPGLVLRVRCALLFSAVSGRPHD
jgi:hypothetical protein